MLCVCDEEPCPNVLCHDETCFSKRLCDKCPRGSFCLDHVASDKHKCTPRPCEYDGCEHDVEQHCNCGKVCKICERQLWHYHTNNCGEKHAICCECFYTDYGWSCHDDNCYNEACSLCDRCETCDDVYCSAHMEDHHPYCEISTEVKEQCKCKRKHVDSDVDDTEEEETDDDSSPSATSNVGRINDKCKYYLKKDLKTAFTPPKEDSKWGEVEFLVGHIKEEDEDGYAPPKFMTLDGRIDDMVASVLRELKMHREWKSCYYDYNAGWSMKTVSVFSEKPDKITRGEYEDSLMTWIKAGIERREKDDTPPPPSPPPPAKRQRTGEKKEDK